MMRSPLLPIALVLCASAGANADEQVHTAFVEFISDLQDPVEITLPGFDTLGGSRQLDAVTLSAMHSGGGSMGVDNDDPFQGMSVRPRVIHSWSLTGPGILPQNFAHTEAQDPVLLAPDDGDAAAGGGFDTSPPDGHLFDDLDFADVPAFDTSADPAPYADVATVSYTLFPDLMVLDLQWLPAPPDALELSISNPHMRIDLTLTYHFTVPCPADWNGDGSADSGDFFEFISAFLAGDADFNGSGGTDSGDFFEFLSAFLAGCP